MFKAKSLLFLIASWTLACVEVAWPGAPEFYKSVTAGIETIETAQTQAEIKFNPGIYRTIASDSALIWDIKKKTDATLMLTMSNGDMGGSSVEFMPRLEVSVIPLQGSCTSYTIGKLVFKKYNKIDRNLSDIKPGNNRNCSGRDALIDIEDHLDLTKDSGYLFQGRLFSALAQDSKQSKFKGQILPTVSKCQTFACASYTESPGPILSVELNDFKAHFKEGTHIDFTSQDSLTLKKTSGVDIKHLKYDTYQDRGDATITEIVALVDTGSIAAGTTKFLFPTNTSTSFRFQNIVVQATSNTIMIKDGRFIGALGDGTRISLGAPGGGTLASGQQESFLALRSGHADLRGIKLTYANHHLEFAVTTGDFDVALSDSQLVFSKANYIGFGYAHLVFSLSCAQAENPDTCIPAMWGPRGTYISATIGDLAVNLTKGRFSLSPQNAVLITDGGELNGAQLRIDTRRRDNLVTGNITNLRLNIATQPFAFDSSTTLDSLRLTLTSSDLQLTDGDPYPSGHMKLSGDLRGGTIDAAGARTTIPFLKASISPETSILLSRDPKDTLRVADGTITGSMNINFGENGDKSHGFVAFDITKLRYYQGQGDAIVNLHDFQFSFSITTPKKDGPFSAFDVEGNYHAYSVDIPIRLAEPLQFPPQTYMAERGRWRLDNKRTIPVKIVASVPGGPKDSHQVKVVDADADLTVPPIGCHAEAYSIGRDYVISGQIDYELSVDRQFISIGDFTINDKLEVDPDIGSCKRIAFVMCWLAGDSAAAPIPIPAIGGLAGLGAGLLCDNKIDKLVENKTADFQNDVDGKVRSFHFQIGR